MAETPGWYAEIAADEAATDARIIAQRIPFVEHCYQCGAICHYSEDVRSWTHKDDGSLAGRNCRRHSGGSWIDCPVCGMNHRADACGMDPRTPRKQRTPTYRDGGWTKEGHDTLHVATTNPWCPFCVPDALIVPTPEPIDYTLPACER